MCFAPVPTDARAPGDYILTSYVLSFKAVSPGKTQALLLLPKSCGVCASWFGGFGFSPTHRICYFLSTEIPFKMPLLCLAFEGSFCRSQSQHPPGLIFWQF